MNFWATDHNFELHHPLIVVLGNNRFGLPGGSAGWMDAWMHNFYFSLNPGKICLDASI
jgi:hypothetical protein